MWCFFEMCIWIFMKLVLYLGVFVLFYFNFWVGISWLKVRDGWNFFEVRLVFVFLSIYCWVLKNVFELFLIRIFYLFYFVMLCLWKVLLKRFFDRYMNEVVVNVSCFFLVLFGYWNNNMFINWNKICFFIWFFLYLLFS